MVRTGQAKLGREYEVAFAVVRVDYDVPPPLNEEADLDGPSIHVDTQRVTVKEVVATQTEAQKEVQRLNELAQGKAYRYFWQGTHLFRSGVSHGSGAEGESREDAHNPAVLRTKG